MANCVTYFKSATAEDLYVLGAFGALQAAAMSCASITAPFFPDEV